MAMRYYLGIAEPGRDNWSISFPAFAGVVTTGETFGQVMENARNALASVIAAMQEDGLAIPENYSDTRTSSDYNAADYHDPRLVMVSAEVGGRAMRINVTMDEGLVARLDSVAERGHSTRSALLARGARMVLAAEAME